MIPSLSRKFNASLWMFKFPLKDYIVLAMLGTMLFVLTSDYFRPNRRVSSDIRHKVAFVDKVFVSREHQLQQSMMHTDSKKSMVFNCSNIADIKVGKKVGHGVSKYVFSGLYQDRKVAVKMVTDTVADVSRCVTKLKEESDSPLSESDYKKCHIFPNMKLMKEILMLQGLDHPNLVQLLGFCVRSEETKSEALTEHGIIAVYEFLKSFTPWKGRMWSAKDKLVAMIEIADLLDYLEHSPAGSLLIPDMKKQHIMLRDYHTIVLNDLDDFNSKDHDCSLTAEAEQDRCPFDLKCVDGMCKGSNAKHNMEGLNRLLFSPLLGCSGNDIVLHVDLTTFIRPICSKLSITQMSANQLKQQLSALLNHLNAWEEEEEFN